MQNPYPLFAQNGGYFFVIVRGINLCTKMGRYGIIQSKYVYRASASVRPGKRKYGKGSP